MLEWKISNLREDYHCSLQFMQDRVEKIIIDQVPELVWFLEYPPIYTAGTSAAHEELIEAKFPVYNTGRGGRFTYHGPGQLVVYMLLDLCKRCAQDIRLYIYNLEQIMIDVFSDFSVITQRVDGKVGVWVNIDSQYKKIGAIGIRVKKWVTYHGISLNINPELSHYKGIVPCGVSDYGVTSLYDLGQKVDKKELISCLKQKIEHNLLT